MKKERVAWGIIGAGGIAGALAQAMPHSRTGRLVAVASRSQEKADKFGSRFNVPKRYGDYQALLDDPDVQAVYVATPHPMHVEWAIRAADAGKHVLCEKPMALNFLDTQAIVEAAIRNDVFLMEAFMYRCNPQTLKLCELVKSGAIGEVRLIRATFGFDAGYHLESRLLNNPLGGGGILDVGCYAISMSRLIAGVAQGKPFADPQTVAAVGHVGPESRCDEWAVASLKFPGGIVAQCSTSVRLTQDSDVAIYGDSGKITVPSPWFCAGQAGGKSTIVVHRYGRKPRTVAVQSGWLYAHEIDTVGGNLHKRQGAWPAMSWDDSLGNMRALDRWRESLGVVYDREKPEAYRQPLDGKPVRVRTPARMPHGSLPGVEKKISRLVMGTMVYGSLPRAAAAYDEFFARGGNAWDTAHVYGDATRSTLGEWVRTRGVRNDVVLIVKGAHTPYCFPDKMREQLTHDLETLQTDYADIYFLHRDNPEVPVSEWVDALNEEVRRGRIRAFGGSNWHYKRIEAANTHALKTGKAGFAALSNHLSLARMLAPLWEGALSSGEPDFLAWHRETRFPLFAWSSQARTFFLPERTEAEISADKEMQRCWASEDNFARRRRVLDLARRRGVQPVAVALAYVLSQAFPLFALIGPANMAEIRTSFDALDVDLTPREIGWLEKGGKDPSMDQALGKRKRMARHRDGVR